MKKVRYLMGAMGAAPALGLMMPAGNATAVTSHSPANKGKTVSLASAHRRQVGDCPPPRGHTSNGTLANLLRTVFGTIDGNCVSFVGALWDGKHTSLDMRTRFYQFGGKVGGDHFNVGNSNTPAPGVTSWKHTISQRGASEACVALVQASANHNLARSAVCFFNFNMHT